MWLPFLLHKFLSFIRFSVHLKKQNTPTSSFSTVCYGALRLLLVKLMCFVSNLRSGTQIFCSGAAGGSRRLLSTTLCCKILKTNEKHPDTFPCVWAYDFFVFPFFFFLFKQHSGSWWDGKEQHCILREGETVRFHPQHVATACGYHISEHTSKKECCALFRF